MLRTTREYTCDGGHDLAAPAPEKGLPDGWVYRAHAGHLCPECRLVDDALAAWMDVREAAGRQADEAAEEARRRSLAAWEARNPKPVRQNRTAAVESSTEPNAAGTE